MTQRQIGYYAVKGPLKANKQTPITTNPQTKNRGCGLDVLFFDGIFVELNCSIFSRLN